VALVQSRWNKARRRQSKLRFDTSSVFPEHEMRGATFHLLDKRIPSVNAFKKFYCVESPHLFVCQLPGPSDTCGWMSARPGGFVFGEPRGLLARGVAPVVPAFGSDVRVHPTVDENHTPVWTPGATQIDALACVGACQAAVAKDESVGFRLAQTPLRRDVACALAVDMAVFEDGCGAAEDEINVPFDVAVFVVLPPAVREERVLPTEKAAVAEHCAIRVDVNRNC